MIMPQKKTAFRLSFRNLKTELMDYNLTNLKDENLSFSFLTTIV